MSRRTMKMFCALLSTIIGAAAHAQTVTSIFKFDGTNGSGPQAALAQAPNGDFYGTTGGGGTNQGGTVFRVTTGGTLTTLYNFCSQVGCTDGEYPYAGLYRAADGDFYGTTEGGGATGYGTLFKITPSGTLRTLHSFCSQSRCTDGANPEAAPIQAANGDLYGTTLNGGTNCAPTGCGTVFKMTPSGVFTTLYSFCSATQCPDGDGPYDALVQAANGDFYGTTLWGGIYDSVGGTIFKISPSGNLSTVYSFCALSGCADGEYLNAGLAKGADGDLYGTTEKGGANGWGTVFRINLSGALTTLYSFCVQSECADGAVPLAGLVQASDGYLYGTTYQGGIAGKYGTLFQITPTGALTTVYNFCSRSDCTDGRQPDAALIQATNGKLYGSTVRGGSDCEFGCGTLFSVSAGPGPSVETEPTSGTVGTTLDIGINLTEQRTSPFR